ncbi:type ISP restriction/modification enzyme [Galactobacter sp.]|uniref:DEAD/DEAH box helicase n=1 Tax=Galactobacter sp. TaxID=2676125 RepID=UPI0025C6A1AF|nr:type ISP restriction/modification enzyme [Galactobacter sp.]
MSTQTFAEVFDRLYFDQSNKSEHDKGVKFERMLKRFLQLDPKFAETFSKVWLWDEWPGRTGRDTGADLVAQDRVTGELTAIQAKFYDPSRPLQKSAVDSFFTQLGTTDFSQGLIVHTAGGISPNLDAALKAQTKETQLFGLEGFEDSSIDWSLFDFDKPDDLAKAQHKHPRPYQREAIEAVKQGFELHDRGKLIMACGTGKTFTSLRLVEEFVPNDGTVLFLVPSIALLQQTLNEWTAQADATIRPFAVCSDTSVGRKNANEDMRAHELGFPATTDAGKLVQRFHLANPGHAVSAGEGKTINVVFSTYQSIDVIAAAQGDGTTEGLPDFDLIVCDEAHRTTGATIAGVDESHFVKVHDNKTIHARKRLYMTATPRIFGEDSKAKADQSGTVLASMDNEEMYGPEFHHLGFGKAVDQGHLADYKVLILAVDESSIATSFQSLLAEDGDMNLDDVARIVGCWNGLSKRGVNGQRLSVTDTAPMHRAVAFTRNIKESRALAAQFDRVSTELTVNRTDSGAESMPDDAERFSPSTHRPAALDAGAAQLRMQAEHVDGTFSVAERGKKLRWLQETVPATDEGAETCRILTNAKCLTEGVDVPSLDAVLFLNPRNSQVDVVQAVGRVMRKSATTNKEYGYIILPIAVPSGQDPETALNDNKKYKVIWDVLQALRAHDDRFEAMINKLDLDRASNKTIDVIGVGGQGETSTGNPTDPSGFQDSLFSLARAKEWEDAIFARMVKKVGDKRYWEDWAGDVKEIADRQVTRINAILTGDDPRPAQEFAGFLEGLRGNLNDGISESDAVDMLVQHLITKPVFDALFEDYQFSQHNPVSQVMDSMLNVLDSYNLDSETGSLEEFYRSVRIRAEGIEDAAGKQKIITELYERFFKLAFPKTAESLGIVYTPLPVVDFILRAVNDALTEHFGVGLSDEGVHILDPFTGTGTFVTRLLQSGLIKPEDLARKYANELHANEILLMAYYIAAINIEATFHGLQIDAERDRRAAAGEKSVPDDVLGTQVGYEPFNGIVLTDTFQMTEDGDTLDEAVFTNNNDRVVEQNRLDIRVIVGNPPYSVGQTNENDGNANLRYPTLDATIENTYAKQSSATLKRNLYDSYIRAIRWASNRVLSQDQGGVVCYVSNGGYIDSNNADGLRKTLTDEFHEIYVYNLRGNQRTAGEQSRKEGGKIFDSGSRATVAILLLIKKPGPVDQCALHYKDIGDYLNRDTKLDRVGEATLANLDWETIAPNEAGDWINQRDAKFDSYAPIGDRTTQSGHSVFQLFSTGVATSRDAWVYSASLTSVIAASNRMIDNYNRDIDGWITAGTPTPIDKFITTDPAAISWSSGLKSSFAKKTRISSSDTSVRSSLYRPFNKQNFAFNQLIVSRSSAVSRFYPMEDSTNIGFYLTSPSTHYPTFAVLATDVIPDLHMLDTGQFFARYSYTKTEVAAAGTLFASSGIGADAGTDGGAEGPDGYTRVDNITDWAHQDYKATYGDQVTKDDVFFYVYALLHSPEYRTRYAADLKKQLPRIPKVEGRERFEAFVTAGQELSALHIGYEDLDPYPMTETVLPSAPTDEYERFAVTKMKYGGKSGAWDKTTLKYNRWITLTGLPLEAQEYMLGSRSGVDWLVERYQVKTDKKSGIVNDPNDWSREHGQPRYIIGLIGRVVALSLRTQEIVNGLPSLGE